jgi:eukaryotic-like serine/threonine-protein kinase
MSPAPAPADIVVAALGADFDIERELGGGMARVFVARDNRLGRRVVVKVVSREALAFDGIARFQREIEFAIGLQHPHIVPILSAGHVEGTPYLVMPYVDGASVRSLLASGPLRVVDAVRILRGVSLALSFAHARGVVHRDIKPDNILLAGGTPVVADFGIAKAIAGSRGPSPLPDPGLTVPGMSLGTPTYMAPEQIAGEAGTDHRADIYSLGVLGYEMLAGEPPFPERHRHFGEVRREELLRGPQERRPDMPRALAALVMDCLRKQPADRPQDAGGIAEALDRPEMLSGGFVVPTPVPAPVAAPRRRTAAIALVLLCLVAAAGILWKSGLSREPAAQAVAAPRLLAVLPLVSIGPDSSQAFVAVRLADQLTSALTGIPGLSVTSRTASAALQSRIARGDSLPPSMAAYIEGAVIDDEGSLNVALRAVDPADGHAIWAASRAAPADSLDGLLAGVVGEVLTEMRSRFAPDSAPTGAPTPTPTPTPP